MKNKKDENDFIKAITCTEENLIKVLRKNSIKTQVELADLLKLSQQNISQKERSNDHITLTDLSNICDKLNVSLVILLKPSECTALLDLETVSSFQLLNNLPPEKQALIFKLIQLLS
ncbi:MAG: helix-turn-helix transcriptional regulator [Clostridium sp.]|nr:helix-turn-helix transcriptional regulator [Clostridium sp.]